MIVTLRTCAVWACSVLALVSMTSCGMDRGDKAFLSGAEPTSRPAQVESGSGSMKQTQPGLHEPSGFFPVELDEVPLGFAVVGDAGGPVLYSSSTLPAWLVGKDALIVDPDGQLTTISLDGSSSLYLPPDLSLFSGYPSAEKPSDQISQEPESRESAYESDQDDITWKLPIGVSVTGPTSAVFLLEDYRLLAIKDGTVTVLRQFGTEFAGPVVVSGSPMEIIIADSAGKILALDGMGSTILWESSGGPVLLSDGLAIFVGADSHLHILEAHNGRLVANSDLANISSLIKPSRDATLIFTVLKDGSLAAMDHSGMTKWIANTGMQPVCILNDLTQVYAVSRYLLVAFDKITGAEVWRLPLPVSPAGDPVILSGSIVFAGTNGKVYASSADAGPSAPGAADPGERISAVIGFRLEKYVRNRSELLATFVPYIDQAVHEGPHAFTLFAYGPVVAGGEYMITWEGEDRDVVLALFNERGDELMANLDEFGTRDSFSYRLDEGGKYFIALGRQDPSPMDEPLFLSVLPVRRN